MEHNWEAWKLFLNLCKHIKCQRRRHKTTCFGVTSTLLWLKLVSAMRSTDRNRERVNSRTLCEVDNFFGTSVVAFDILDDIMKELPGFPIVLHGSSSVPQEYVDIINEHGGKLPNAVGIPEDQLRQAAKSAVCKINIDSDSRLAFTAGVRQTFDEHPEYFDPRQYCGKAREYMEDLYKHKIIDVLGSENKLVNCD